MNIIERPEGLTDVVRLAKEAGCHASVITGAICFNPEVLERFANLVAAHEREACAKVCEKIKGVKLQGYEFAAAIRARGMK